MRNHSEIVPDFENETKRCLKESTEKKKSPIKMAQMQGAANERPERTRLYVRIASVAATPQMGHFYRA